jgi:hypothetical protein
MKIDRISQYVSMAALAALLPLALASSRAASAPSLLDADGAMLQQAQLRRVEWVWDDAKRHKLRHAYWLLEQADRDYGGHKDKAIEEIRKAGKLMGLDLRGEGFGGERQPWSDVRLVEAKHTLEDIVDPSHRREHEHIWKAIVQINRALGVH